MVGTAHLKLGDNLGTFTFTAVPHLKRVVNPFRTAVPFWGQIS